MATTQITHPATERIGTSVTAGALAVITGLGVAIIVTASMVLAPAPTPASYVVGHNDDYGLRHAFGPATVVLSVQDDWWLRHHGVTGVLGESADWYMRHRGEETRR